MTREEIERSFGTRDGIIKSPGKFEGEPVWAPYLYDLWMEGCQDKQGGNQEEGTNAWVAYVVDDAMRAEFPRAHRTGNPRRGHRRNGQRLRIRSGAEQK